MQSKGICDSCQVVRKCWQAPHGHRQRYENHEAGRTAGIMHVYVCSRAHLQHHAHVPQCALAVRVLLQQGGWCDGGLGNHKDIIQVPETATQHAASMSAMDCTDDHSR